jgi:hypothetical protein
MAINAAYPSKPHHYFGLQNTSSAERRNRNGKVTIKRRSLVVVPPKQVNLWSLLKKTETKMVIDKKTKERSAVKKCCKGVFIGPIVLGR